MYVWLKEEKKKKQFFFEVSFEYTLLMENQRT